MTGQHGPGRRGVGRSRRHVDAVARTHVRLERFALGFTRRRVDLPVLATERLQDEDVVRIGVQRETLGARGRDVRVHLAGVPELQLERATERGDRLPVAVQSLQDDRRAVVEQLA